MAGTQQDYLKHLVIFLLYDITRNTSALSIARVQVILKMCTTYVTMHDIFGHVSLADTGNPEIQIV